MSSRPTVVYIASPMTHGYWVENFNRASDCAERLMQKGYSFFNPVPSYFHEIRHKHRSGEEWLQMDFGLIAVCDCLLRLPGKSEGADVEMDFAVRHDKPVFTSELELFAEMATTIEELEQVDPPIEDEVSCKTCNDTHQVGEEIEHQGRSMGFQACPDCTEPITESDTKIEEILEVAAENPPEHDMPNVKDWKNPTA